MAPIYIPPTGIGSLPPEDGKPKPPNELGPAWPRRSMTPPERRRSFFSFT